MRGAWAAVALLVLALARPAYAGSLAEGRPCTTGPDCRSFICLNGRCAGAGNACTATAATRAECMDSVFVKASCTKGKYDRILTTLDMFAAPMARGPAREIACFNATTPGLEVARCVSVSDGAIGRYGLQCGAVMVRGLSDGDPPPVRQSSGAGGAAAAGGLAAAIGAAVVAAVGLMV